MALLSPPLNDPEAYPEGGRSSAFFSSGHHHILLTRRFFFNEAYAMYWRSTNVVNGDTSLRSSVRYLLSPLQKVSKPHIPHLRGLVFDYSLNRSAKIDYIDFPCSMYLVFEKRQLLGQLPDIKSYTGCEMFCLEYLNGGPNGHHYYHILEELFMMNRIMFMHTPVSPTALWRIKVRMRVNAAHPVHPAELTKVRTILLLLDNLLLNIIGGLYQLPHS